ncbi:deoxyguanosinetriphosphate triphosphohydrolase [Bartonella sp. M0280]|uniref:deoxyguanosinetriphosphate triphosphohydrolase n=1 Tax=Bartonella apihabitans TaxID=2750929 RepID=UPI0018DC4604|nr:deoxyguanosinetriphosphate triphosphohydrolase [Bartonella apihabitans]MBI0166940.1 deoxyguanosinetriphosphate triphosphohydrolase [Bartonella apihabitans]
MDIKNIGFGYRPRAPYASDPAKSRGRLFYEPESPTRTPFQRDRDRIIHSNAFRRLNHKTQVFIADEGDLYRTRLTHTIEVSQIARALARALRLDEDLAEAIALVHDFGHTPFGHAGEDALNERMKLYGGFDHNAQGLRIVTSLEHRYPKFNGLNLTWETLEGLAKHNGPLAGPAATNSSIPLAVAEYNEHQDLELDRFASLEAQCAAIADDIAYNAHDIDDGLRARLLSLKQLEDVELTAGILGSIKSEYPDLDKTRTGYEVVRRQITLMVEDVIQHSFELIAEAAPTSVDDVHAAGRQLVNFSSSMAAKEKNLKKFLYKNLYHHEYVWERRREAEKIVANLFDFYFKTPQAMPDDWYQATGDGDVTRRARVISDFLSGMTDNYAQREYRRLFDRETYLS